MKSKHLKVLVSYIEGNYGQQHLLTYNIERRRRNLSKQNSCQYNAHIYLPKSLCLYSIPNTTNTLITMFNKSASLPPVTYPRYTPFCLLSMESRQRKPNYIIIVVCKIKHYVLFLLSTNKIKFKNPQKVRCH